jgi:hypothetical protein
MEENNETKFEPFYGVRKIIFIFLTHFFKKPVCMLFTIFAEVIVSSLTPSYCDKIEVKKLRIKM